MEKGTIVKYDGGFYRITRETKNTVNLGAVFGNHIYWKGIPKSEVTEAAEEFNEYWTNSETYKSM